MNTSYGHYNLDARSLESVCFIQSLDLKKKKKGKSLPPNICGVILLQLMMYRLKRSFICNFSHMNFLMNRV